MTTRRLARASLAAAGALGAWAAVLVALPFVGPPGRQLAVIGAPERVVPLIVAAGGQMIEVRGNVTLAQSDRTGFAATLYRAGAPLVLEGRASAGCIRS